MKKDGKYRFSLQFGADTEEQIRAGELLERLGNKKSQILVDALNEYLETHPELEKQDAAVRLKLTPVYDRAKIEQIVKEIMENRMGVPKDSTGIQPVCSEETNIIDDISEMLDNIAAFG